MLGDDQQIDIALFGILAPGGASEKDYPLGFSRDLFDQGHKQFNGFDDLQLPAEGIGVID